MPVIRFDEPVALAAEFRSVTVRVSADDQDGEKKSEAMRVSDQMPHERGVTANRILAVTAALFRQHGYSGTTTRQISDALGIQKASLYHHVSGKEDLLYEICLAALHDVDVGASEAVAAADDPEAKLRALVRGHTLAMLANVNFSYTMLTDMRSLSGERLQEVVRLRDKYERWMEQLLIEAQQAGDIRSSHSARHLTLGLLNLLNWTMFWYRADGDLTPEQVAELLESIFFDGVARSADQQASVPGQLSVPLG
jgi:TetR/AcrR family transcriptional regulator, cholesterol catabolism regulator